MNWRVEINKKNQGHHDFHRNNNLPEKKIKKRLVIIKKKEMYEDR